MEVHKIAEKRTRQVFSHLDRTNLVNKRFIVCLSGIFFLRNTAGIPERARCLHLARSGGQSHLAIWIILPARGARHIINYFMKCPRKEQTTKKPIKSANERTSKGCVKEQTIELITYSADTRTMNARALFSFSLYFFFFSLILTFFPN